MTTHNLSPETEAPNVSFEGAILLDSGSFPRYSELEVRAHSTATPLDPSHTYVGGILFRNHGVAYYESLATELTQNMSIPEDYGERIAQELEAQLLVRCERNEEALHRLLVAFRSREPGEDMIRIVNRARAGQATPVELLALVSAYPEIISVEVGKFVKPFDRAEFYEALSHFSRIARALAGPDIDMSRHLGSASTDEIVEETGAYIKKIILARYKDGAELVIKMTFLPPDSIRSSGEVWDYPVSVSCYLRRQDYKTRVGYVPEGMGSGDNPKKYKKRIRERLGASASECIDVMEGLPTNGQVAYAKGVLKAADVLGPPISFRR